MDGSLGDWEVIPGSGRSVRDPVEIVPYDDAWPQRFEDWRARLAAALGPTAVRIEHVGSTAVPGLAAKPVVDIQVSVPDVDDEAAYVPAIEALGVAFRSRDPVHRYFRPAGNAPRLVQIHVCGSGSDWEREHLQFRDALRASPALAAEYLALKRELAARFPDDRIAYAAGKSGLVGRVLGSRKEGPPDPRNRT